jgi:hypothetical protein
MPAGLLDLPVEERTTDTVNIYSYEAGGGLAARLTLGVARPRIIGQPVPLVVAKDTFAAFSVVVADARGMRFQWRFNGTDIPGATGDSLALTSTGATDEGRYSVVVTNDAGSLESEPATLMLDTDRDDLPDTWEIAKFGTVTAQRREGDPDRDAASNLAEFRGGTNPLSTTSVRPRLTAYGDAGGTVEVAPMKLDYDWGEPVTLTATPTAPYVFVGWTGDLDTGDLVGTTNPVTFRMSRHTTVQARFSTPVPIPPDLIACWRGESGAADLLGGHDGAFFAGSSGTAPSISPHGKTGGAFDLDAGVHIRVPDAPALRPARLTVEMWLVPRVADPVHQTLIARGSSTDDNDTWWLGLFNGRPRFWSHGAVLLEGPETIPLNTWTHLAFSFDGTTKRLYVNGRQVAEQGGMGPLVYDPAPVPVTIGADWVAGRPAGPFTGLVDEVALYDRALTANEMADLHRADFTGKDFTRPYFTTPSRLPDTAIGRPYTQRLTTTLGAAPVTFALSGGAPPPGIALSSGGVLSGTPAAAGVFDFVVRAVDAVGSAGDARFILPVFESVTAPAGIIGWWRAEGNAQDAIGTGHGTLRGGAGFAPGKVGQAFSLDGADDCVEIPDAPARRPASLTVEAWVAFDDTSGLRAIITKPVGGGTSDSFALWLTGGTLKGAVGDASGLGPELATPFAPAPGRWYHLAYTFDDGAGRQAIYIDGARAAAGTVTRSIGYDAQPLLLGRDTENGTPNFFFKGRIDEPAIYDRALTETEIASIHTAGPAGKHP